MNLQMLIKSAILSLKFNKVRVFLTMIGIIIGISSVVAILSIGAGLQNEVSKSSEETEVNTLKVEYTPKNMNFMFNDAGESAFEESDMDQLKTIDGIEKVESADSNSNMMMGMSANATYFDKSTFLFLDSFNNENLKLLAGRTITNEDNEFENRVVILTEECSKELFGDNFEEGIGQAIKFNNNLYEVIGIVGKESADFLYGEKNYVPKFVKDDFSSGNISSLNIKVKEGYDLKEVFKDVKVELESLHPDLDGEYKESDPMEIIKAFQNIIGGVTGFIAIVSGISLFVAGVGVMNIMYVSVTERKREIGIRRAIGASPRQILLLFLIESIIITIIGGIIGVGFGFAISKIAGLFIPFKPVLTGKVLFISFITSTVVGVVFGITPAVRAAKMDPIKAIYK